MNKIIGATALAVGLAFTAIPASAVIYCKTVGVPKGCVARPAAVVVAPAAVVVRPAPVVVAPAAVVVAPGVSATNQNGGVNRVGVRR